MTAQAKPIAAASDELFYDIPDPATTLTPMQEYMFDLNGYLILRGALSASEVDAMNATYDQMQRTSVKGKGWSGNVAVDNSGRQEGMIFHQLYEAGPVW